MLPSGFIPFQAMSISSLTTLPSPPASLQKLSSQDSDRPSPCKNTLYDLTVTPNLAS